MVCFLVVSVTRELVEGFVTFTRRTDQTTYSAQQMRGIGAILCSEHKLWIISLAVPFPGHKQKNRK